jgi:hypothetical protein
MTTDNINYQMWSEKVDSVSKNDVVNTIKKLFKKFGSSYDFIKIDDPILLNAFTNIGNHLKVIVAFDVEFISAHDDSSIYGGYIKSQKNTCSFIREIGLIVFIKDDQGFWYYLGNIFVNFPTIIPIFGVQDLKYLMATYSTVTDETAAKMKLHDEHFNFAPLFDPLIKYFKKNQKDKFVAKIDELCNNFQRNPLIKQEKTKLIDKLEELRKLDFDMNYLIKEINYLKRLVKDIPFSTFGGNLTGKYLDMFTKQWELYNNDSLVIDRLLSKTDANKFLQLFIEMAPRVLFVVKGQRDMEAVKNSTSILNVVVTTGPLVSYHVYINFPHFYDIEIFNELSRRIYGSAQLEKTFEGMTNTSIYKTHGDPLFSKIFGDLKDVKAHNPMIDSLYTIIVAAVVNMGLNDYFSKPDRPQLKRTDRFDITEKYLKKYKQYKKIYLQLKR